jgi:hypothetical protein
VVLCARLRGRLCDGLEKKLNRDIMEFRIVFIRGQTLYELSVCFAESANIVLPWFKLVLYR